MRLKLPSWCQINARSKAWEWNCCAARSRSRATINYAASPPKCCGTILPCKIFSRKLGFVCDCCPTPLPYRRCLTLEFCDGSHRRFMAAEEVLVGRKLQVISYMPQAAAEVKHSKKVLSISGAA